MRLIITTGEKGGVGKTLFNHLLVAWARKNNVRFAGVDTDQANKFFHALHKDEVSEVTFYRPDGSLDLSQIHKLINHIAEAMEGGDTDTFIIDMGAAQLNIFLSAFRETDLFAEAGDRLKVTAAYLIVNDPSSVSTLKTNQAAFDDVPGAQWLIVRNQNDGLTSLYDNSKTRQAMIERGAVELELVKLPDSELRREWMASGKTLEDFTAGYAKWSERSMLQKWMSTTNRQLDAIRDRLTNVPVKPKLVAVEKAPAA